MRKISGAVLPDSPASIATGHGRPSPPTALSQRAIRRFSTAEGLEAVIAPPERLCRQLREEVPKWPRVAKAANVQAIQ